MDHGGDVELLWAQLDLPLVEAGHVQQIVDQPDHLMDLPFDHITEVLEIGFLRADELQHVHGITDGSQGIAQGMGQRQQQFVPVPVLAWSFVGLRFFPSLLRDVPGLPAGFSQKIEQKSTAQAPKSEQDHLGQGLGRQAHKGGARLEQKESAGQ